MRVTGPIRIERITHGKRLPMNPKVLFFAMRMRLGYIFPPIHVQRKTNGRFSLRAGRHRLAALKLLGKTEAIAHYAVAEDPRPHKDIEHRKQDIRHNVPQADGYSLMEIPPLEPTPWAVE